AALREIRRALHEQHDRGAVDGRLDALHHFHSFTSNQSRRIAPLLHSAVAAHSAAPTCNHLTTSSSATTRATLFTLRASEIARSRAAALSTVPTSVTTRRYVSTLMLRAFTRSSPMNLLLTAAVITPSSAISPVVRSSLPT